MACDGPEAVPYLLLPACPAPWVQRYCRQAREEERTLGGNNGMRSTTYINPRRRAERATAFASEPIGAGAIAPAWRVKVPDQSSCRAWSARLAPPLSNNFLRVRDSRGVRSPSGGTLPDARSTTRSGRSLPTTPFVARFRGHPQCRRQNPLESLLSADEGDPPRT